MHLMFYRVIEMNDYRSAQPKAKAEAKWGCSSLLSLTGL